MTVGDVVVVLVERLKSVVVVVVVAMVLVLWVVLVGILVVSLPAAWAEVVVVVVAGLSEWLVSVRHTEVTICVFVRLLGALRSTLPGTPPCSPSSFLFFLLSGTPSTSTWPHAF